MAIRPETNTGAMVKVPLENHPREDYSDVLEQFHGDFPADWAYQAEPAVDVDLEGTEQESQEGEVRGMEAEAQIDFSGPYAVIYLPENLYGSTPGDELTDEAERVLGEWIEAMRHELGVPGW